MTYGNLFFLLDRLSEKELDQIATLYDVSGGCDWPVISFGLIRDLQEGDFRNSLRRPPEIAPDQFLLIFGRSDDEVIEGAMTYRSLRDYLLQRTTTCVQIPGQEVSAYNVSEDGYWPVILVTTAGEYRIYDMDPDQVVLVFED